MAKSVIRAVAVAASASAVTSANSQALPMNHYEHSFKAGLAVDLNTFGSGASGTYTVQHTFDDPANANAVWFDHSTLSAQTADAISNLDYPVNAIRVQVQACAATDTTVSAEADLMVIQAGDHRYETRTDEDIFTAPYDGFNAVVAYGLRRLYSDYTGPLIQIRRALSAGADYHPGFGARDFFADSGGRLDTAAIDAYVTASSVGMISRWYDQSGDENNVTALATADQPLYKSTGIDGKPAIEFNRVNTVQLIASGGPLFQAWRRDQTAVSIVFDTTAAGQPISQGTIYQNTSAGTTHGSLRETRAASPSAAGYKLNTVHQVSGGTSNYAVGPTDFVWATGAAFHLWETFSTETVSATDPLNEYRANLSAPTVLGSAGGSANPVDVSSFFIFGNDTSNTDNWNGAVYEFAIINNLRYDPATDNADVSALRININNYWGTA